MRYATAAGFRQALDDRLKAEAAKTRLGLARLRKRVAFELFLRSLVAVAPDRSVLKGGWLRAPCAEMPPRAVRAGDQPPCPLGGVLRPTGHRQSAEAMLFAAT